MKCLNNYRSARPRKKCSETIGEFHLLISAVTVSPEATVVTQPGQCVLTTICKLRHDIIKLRQHIVSDSHAFRILETFAVGLHLPGIYGCSQKTVLLASINRTRTILFTAYSQFLTCLFVVPPVMPDVTHSTQNNFQQLHWCLCCWTNSSRALWMLNALHFF